MGNIIRFNRLVDYESFINPRLVTKIGEGTEGSMYSDGEFAYKNFDKEGNLFSEMYRDYPEGIITTSDLDLSTFVFPIDLYVIRLRLVGLKTRLVKNNFFKDWNYSKTIDDFKGLDFDSFLSSIDKTKKDIDVITKSKISIVDLPGNLVFDGESLIGVDTCFYHKASPIEQIGLKKKNNEQFIDAIKYLFSCLIPNTPSLQKNFGENASEADVIKGIEKVKTLLVR